MSAKSSLTQHVCWRRQHSVSHPSARC